MSYTIQMYIVHVYCHLPRDSQCGSSPTSFIWPVMSCIFSQSLNHSNQCMCHQTFGWILERRPALSHELWMQLQQLPSLMRYRRPKLLLHQLHRCYHWAKITLSELLLPSLPILLNCPSPRMAGLLECARPTLSMQFVHKSCSFIRIQ